jgi:hypothetical protein
MDPLFCKIHIVQNLRPKLTGAGVLGCLLLGALAWAGDKPGYKDIYLTQESRTQVRLTNRLGHSTLVKPEEIIGIDRHPVLRKLTLKSLHGIGLPGPIIVPAAFEDANDYVCKYCDAFH